jgi:protein SCO1/2
VRLRRTSCHVALLALVVVSVVGCGADNDSTTAATNPGGVAGVVRPEALQVGSVVLPDVTTDPLGVPFEFTARPGALLVGYFGYTSCPDVCPTTLSTFTSALAQLDEAQAARVELAMITIDPERDTPERLSQYVRSFLAPSHAIRTTDPGALEAAQDAFGAQSSVENMPDGTVEVAHSATTYVIDENGTVLVEWLFGTSADSMAHDLRLLLERTDTTA